MKKKWLWILTLVLVIPAVLLSGCGCGGPTTAGAINLANQQSGIWVTGEGEVTVVPDIATLSLGVEARAETAEEARTEAAEAMDRVMTTLKDNGVAEKDIQTKYFSVYPIIRWNDEKNEEVITGYRVSNTVTAKVRDIEEIGTIIDVVIEAGGDLIRINNIEFSVDDTSVYHGEAREEAMADAQAKAEQLAAMAGVSLGKPTYVSESIYMPSFGYPRMEMMEMPVPAAETPISPGEMEITLTVQVAYAILD